jgi:hypothetical protein
MLHISGIGSDPMNEPARAGGGERRGRCIIIGVGDGVDERR